MVWLRSSPPLLSMRKPTLTPAPCVTVCSPDSLVHPLGGQLAHPPLLPLWVAPGHPFSGRLELTIIRPNAVLSAPPARQNARKANTSSVAASMLWGPAGKLALVNSGEPLEFMKLSEYGPNSEVALTTLRVPPWPVPLRMPPRTVAPVQGEEEHGPPPSTVLVSVRKEGNTPPCMKPLVIRLAVPVHRTSPEVARRYAMGGGGGDNGDGGGSDGECGGGLGGGGGDSDGDGEGDGGEGDGGGEDGGQN